MNEIATAIKRGIMSEMRYLKHPSFAPAFEAMHANADKLDKVKEDKFWLDSKDISGKKILQNCVVISANEEPLEP